MYMIIPDYVEYDDSLEYLGPLEGWSQEREYCPTWIPLGGLSDHDALQYPIRTVATRCAADTPVYIFWDKQNTHNLNAVGAYYWDQRRDSIVPDNLLGYLPDSVASGCVNDYLAEDKRFVGIIRKIFTSESGSMDVYIELVAFSNVAKRKKLQREQRLGASPV